MSGAELKKVAEAAHVEGVLEEGEGETCLPEKFTIIARDGYELGASGFTPDENIEKKIVIICGTLATPRYFYASLGCFLSTQGFPAVIFDYRGIGESAPDSLRGFSGNLSDWGQKDLAAVLDWVHREFPDFQIMVIGHGVGGLLPAMAPNNHLIDGLITISTANHHPSYFKGHRGARRIRITTQVVMPPMVKSLGYVPTKRLKLRADLPKNVFFQWSKWRRWPDYLFADEDLGARQTAAGLKCPVMATIVEDDMWAPEAAVKAFHQHLANAYVTYWPLKPAEYHIDKFGHFGPITSQARGHLWADFAQWIDAIPAKEEQPPEGDG